ncbi:MAG: PDZ domain-containing protein [Pseudomonadota bacterium]
MKMRQLAAAIALVMAIPLSTAGIAAEPTTQPAVPAVAQGAGGYLGVVLHSIPRALRAQLAGVLPAGQGVMIQDVADDSPAARAGLRAYDILLSLDDQKLFSTEQLSQLVRTEGADKTVTLKRVRNGVTDEVQVTLGEAQAAVTGAAAGERPWTAMPRYHHAHPRAPYAGPSPHSAEGSWDTFDALSLQKLADGSYQAEIRYLDVNGKLETYQFTGSRDEIRRQVMRQRNLPAVEREQLLNALSARDELAWPVDPFGHRMFMMPWTDIYPDPDF